MGSRTHLDEKQVSLKKHEKYFYTGNPYTGMQVKNVTNSWHNIGNSIKSGGAKLVLLAHPFPRSE